jgi:hypothetical protein
VERGGGELHGHALAGQFGSSVTRRHHPAGHRMPVAERAGSSNTRLGVSAAGSTQPAVPAGAVHAPATA